MKYRNDLTFERARQVLVYAPGTGQFTWKASPDRSPAWIGRYADKQAGYRDKDGRLSIRVDGILYLASRLAWLLQTGVWPTEEVDHESRDDSDNSWNNLREANRSQQLGNIGHSRRNTSGVRGVCWDSSRGKWMAKIKIGKKWKNIGRFDAKEAARDAYLGIAQAHWGKFFNDNTVKDVA